MKNQKGFGIIEVLVVTAIMSVVLAGIAQMSQYSMLTSSTADLKNQATALTASVSQVALNDTSCTLAVTKTPQAYSQHIKFDMPNGDVVAPNIDITAYGVYTQSLTFTGDLVATGGDGSHAYYGVLQLALGTHKQVIGPQSFSPKALGSIYLTVSPGGIVTHCGTVLPVLPTTPIPIVPSVLTEAQIKAQCVAAGLDYNNGKCVPKEDHAGGCDH